MSRPVVLVVALLIAACRPHVVLKPPAPNLTAAQRVQFFEGHRAVSEKLEWQGTSSCVDCNDVTRTLNLANGTQVFNPEDVLPLLSPHSDSAKEIRAARSSRRKARWALLGMAIGAGVALAAARSAYNNPAHYEVHFTPNQKLALGLGFGGLLVSGILTAAFRIQASRSEGRAYAAYNDGLADAVKVCVVGVRVVACEEVLPGAAGF